MEKELEVKYLEALGEGDHEAFNMLFMSYHSLVKRFLFGFIKENMPPQRKQIFKMSRKEGLSNEEISLKLNINKRTVENHITQALADLRKVLKIVLPFFI